MTLYELLEATKDDYDICDTEYDICVTVSYIGEETDDYDKFCNSLMKKVEVRGNKNGFDANWSELIKKHLDKFKAFSKEHWKPECQYEDDEDEFVYQWIREFDNYLAGKVPDSFYATLVAFLDTLTKGNSKNAVKNEKAVDDETRFKKRCYEMYQLDWMKNHGYSLQAAFNVLKEGYAEATADGIIDGGSNCDDDFDVLKEYFKEHGFNGEIFACEAEFFDCEYQDAEYMEYLLPKELWEQYNLFCVSENVEINHHIQFEERYDDEDNMETTLYFIAPKEMLTERGYDYPDAVSMEISLKFPLDNLFPELASVSISPTNADGEDYDWIDIYLPYDEIATLIKLAERK